MNDVDIRKYIDFLKRHDVREKLEVLYPMVLGCMNNLDHGKRFLPKEKFLEDFNKWKDSEYEDFVFIPEFTLGDIIPDESMVDVKFIPLMSSMVDMERGDEVYFWVIQLHNDLPIFNGKRVNGLCRTTSRIPIKDGIEDNRKSLTVSCLIFGDKRSFSSAFPHLIRHELTHSIITIINSVDDAIINITDNEGDEFTITEFSEFIADLLPYYTIHGNDGLSKFREALYVSINPTYSSLYDKILNKLSTMGNL